MDFSYLNGCLELKKHHVEKFKKDRSRIDKVIKGAMSFYLGDIEHWWGVNWANGVWGQQMHAPGQN